MRLAGLASAVPENFMTTEDDAHIFGVEDAQKISQAIGVRRRPVVAGNMCASDLCLAAAEPLLESLNWERDSVDVLIFVSQTPDYILPATSCSLHGRLGLSTNCAAFDVNLGCSGYVYGLWLASQLLAGGAQRVLLLAGDTISRLAAPQDRSVAPLFGDAGTATALEILPKSDIESSQENSSEMVFELGTDGRGQKHLIVPAGAARQPLDDESRHRAKQHDGNVRSDADLYMNGAEIFTFTLREVPPLVANILQKANLDVQDVDAFVMHQANAFMLKHLAKRMKLPADKVVLALEEFGNTSCASIPLAMTHTLSEQLREKTLKLLLAGFGVGFSWGAATLSCGPLTVLDVISVPNSSDTAIRLDSDDVATE